MANIPLLLGGAVITAAYIMVMRPKRTFPMTPGKDYIVTIQAKYFGKDWQGVTDALGNMPNVISAKVQGKGNTRMVGLHVKVSKPEKFVPGKKFHNLGKFKGDFVYLSIRDRPSSWQDLLKTLSPI